MSNMQELSRILIVRNGEVAAWESSTYILEKGEFGIGFYPKGEQLLPILKVGDGTNLWVNLPQASYLLTEDIILSTSFGKHKVENGWLNAGGEGQYLADWLKDALCYIVTDPNELKRHPSANFINVEIATDTGTLDPGSKITTIFWNAEADLGEYIFGSFDRTTNEISENKGIDTDFGFTVSYRYDMAENAVALSDGLSGSANIEDLNIIIEKDKTDYGIVKGVLSWNEARNGPLNNHGEPVEGAFLAPGTITCDIPLTIITETTPCFCGSFSEEKTEEEINSELFYGMKGTLANPENSAHYIIPEGTKTIAVACLADYDVSIFNKTAAAEMLGCCKSKEVVFSANGATYKMYYFSPIIPYINPILIKVTWR